MKKLRFIFLAVIILATMIAFSVCANAAVIASGNCGANGSNAKYTLDSDGTLTIYGSGKIKDVEDIYTHFISEEIDQKVVKNIVIQDGITEIGVGSFAYFLNTESVVMADSVTKIGDSAFYFCKASSIRLSQNLTEISPYAFCASGIESIVIPEGVTTIGFNAFSGCDSLKSVVLPESLTTIESSAFSGCENLKNINLPSNVKKIGEKAFGYTPEIIGTGVVVVDGVTFTKDMKTLVKYPSTKADTSYTVPESVETILSYAFYNCTNLTALNLNDGLIRIGTNAFDGCLNIKELSIPASVVDLANGFVTERGQEYMNGKGGILAVYDPFEGILLDNVYVYGMETDIFMYFEYRWGMFAKNVYILKGSASDKSMQEYLERGRKYIPLMGNYKEAANIYYFTPHTHSYTSEVIKAATCTATGTRKFTCSCGDTYTETIAKLPHESDNWTVLIPAKAGAEGVECGLCKVCGVVAMRSIEALPKDRPVFRLTPAKTESGYAVTLSLENNVNGFYSLDIMIKYDASKLTCIKTDTSNAIAKFEAANTSGSVFVNYTDTAYMPNKGELCTMYFEPNGDLLSGNTEVVINTVVSDNPYTAVNCTVNLGEEEAPENTTVIMTIGQAAGFVSGKAYALDAAPIIRNDRTMLPVRFVAEAFGAEVGWDGATSTATLKTEDTEIKITIGANTAIVNGEEVTLDSPAFIENSRTYLPVRFVAEKLGASVAWNGTTSTATLTK